MFFSSFCIFRRDMVRGYDFLVNAVWPELVANIEARTPSIFAPGNPSVFHQVVYMYAQISQSCLRNTIS